MEKRNLLVPFLIIICWFLQISSCLFAPVRGNASQVHYNVTSQSRRYPDESNVRVADYDYFLSKLNFDAIPGKIVVGAADKLYLLDLDLSLDTALNLTTSTSNLDTCRTDRSDNPEFACHNHIRVYDKIPGRDTMLVCGTHAGVEPRCLGVDLSVNGLTIPSGNGVVASDGIISYYPEFSQFGGFRNDTTADSVYLSAGFFPGDSGAGRHFSISVNNITRGSQTESSLETVTLFQTINANNNWLRFPVVFVGAEKADYPPSAQEGDYQFWFIFLKERDFTNDVIHTQLARVCRNDPGSQLTVGGINYFTSFIKARIFCERRTPATFDSIHTLDYLYNSMTSFVFSPEGRYYSSSSMSSQKLLYASFTGPANGPVGSALCVYSAESTVGRSLSVFDIFKEDLFNIEGSMLEENEFIECDPQGRPEEDQQLLFINPEKSVQQLESDPLLILQDEVVTQMVQDSVCVLTRDSSTVCVNQDILFLGLDSGRVLKVVLATDSNGGMEPVISEDIELDDENSITGMSIEDEDSLLYVTTWSHIYRLPLQRCSRFNTCRECVGSRDPYCVWGDDSQECIVSPLTAEQGSSQGTVNDTRFFQNIHTGSATGCNYPEIGFQNTSITVNEGTISLSIEIFASKPGSIELYLENGTATGGEDFVEITEEIYFDTNGTYSVTITLVEDGVVEDNEWFIGRLRPVMNNGVIITTDLINITIIDDDSVEVYFSSMNYSANEGESYVNLTVNIFGVTNFISPFTLQTMDGSALAGEDYFSQDLELSFDSLSTTINVIIPIINDIALEADEEFYLSLSVPEGTHGVSIGLPAIAAITLIDDDEVIVSFLLSYYTFSEEDGAITINVTKSGETTLPVNILLTTQPGTASAPSDFTELNGVQFTLMPEQTSLAVTLTLNDDEVAENEEFFLVSLSTTDTRGVSVNSQVTRIVIEDTDSVLLRLASTIYTWTEGDGMVSVLVEKIGFNERVISSTVQALPNSALEGSDYILSNQSSIDFYPEENQKAVTLFVIDDDELEEIEHFLLTLENDSGALYDNNSYANIVIIDNDEVTVEITVEDCSFSVSESAGSVELILVRHGLSAIPVEVLVSFMNETAIESSDFTSNLTPARVTIPPTLTFSTPLVVSIVDDDIVEREEYFSVSLSSSQSGVSTTELSAANISISDDDYVVVAFAAPSITVSEEIGYVNVTIAVVDGIHSIPVSIIISTQSDSAEEYLDYEPVVMNIVFEPEDSERNFTINLVNDVLSEESETFQVFMTENNDGALIGMNSQVTVSIQDFDSVEVGFSMESYSVSEVAGWVTVVIDIRGQYEDSIGIIITTGSITAITGEDYQSLDTELTLDGGESNFSVTINVLLYNDAVREETEELRVQLTLQPDSRQGLNLGLESAIIQIEDDDSISIGWEENSYTVSESQGILIMNLAVKGSTSYNFTLLISTDDGSAIGGSDYNSLFQHQIISSFSSSNPMVELTILNDDDIENVENLRVKVETVEGEQGIVINDPETVVYITSDDVLQVQFSSSTYTVMEGESALLTISATALSPFNYSIRARIASMPSNYLYLLGNVVTISAQSMTSYLPVFAVPDKESETQTIDIELEAEEETPPSVVLGAESKAKITILPTDICSSETENSMPAIAKSVSTPSPSVSTPDKPTVEGNTRKSESQCLYPSMATATGISAVLAVLVAVLLATAIVLFLCLMHTYKSRNPHVKSIMNVEERTTSCDTSEVLINPGTETKENMSSFDVTESTSPPETTDFDNKPPVKNNERDGEINDTYL